MSLFIRVLKQICSINWVKTIYFNLKYLPLKKAIHLPVFIYNRTDLYKTKGRIILNVPPRMGLVKIGPHGLGTQDIKYSRTIWDVSGTLVINGEVSIGRGSRICIDNEAILTLGNGFIITGLSTIICQKAITFGDDSLLSWDIQIMDTDFHRIIDTNGDTINSPRPIHIGNHVWIGCRTTILKGVSVADDVVISANSTITKSITDAHCVVGGIGNNVAVLKKEISWER